ncbi:MAG: hypothetical protein KKH98_14250 [Spirochaetes bacterium]|nr:hypothetical protein [Spirochaetota bacterium]
MKEEYKSRKFVVYIASSVVLTIGLFTKFVDPGNFTIGLVSLAGLYIGGNAIVNFSKGEK